MGATAPTPPLNYGGDHWTIFSLFNQVRHAKTRLAVVSLAAENKMASIVDRERSDAAHAQSILLGTAKMESTPNAKKIEAIVFAM